MIFIVILNSATTVFLFFGNLGTQNLLVSFCISEHGGLFGHHVLFHAIKTLVVDDEWRDGPIGWPGAPEKDNSICEYYVCHLSSPVGVSTKPNPGSFQKKHPPRESMYFYRGPVG